MDLWTILLIIIVVGSRMYFFGTRNYNYFEKLGIPYVRPIPFFGNLTRIIFNVKGLPDILQETYACHPDAKYVGFYDFFTPVIILKDPELVKSIAIKHFNAFPDRKSFPGSPAESLYRRSLFALKGDEWKKIRTLLTPAFTSNKMKTMFKIMSQCAIGFIDNLEKLSPKPEALDIKDTFGRYTMDIIASVAFGLSVNSIEDPDNEFHRMGQVVVDLSGFKMFKFLIIRSFPGLAKLLNIRFLDSKKSDYFNHVIKTTINIRDAQGIVRSDMIHLMMEARGAGGAEKSALSLEDMAAQAFVFLLGGFESPASTMSFAAYLLAINPDVQRKLQAEIDQVLARSSGDVSYEDLNAMKYLDAVIRETLRLYPPAVLLDRIGPKGFTLPPALPGLEPVQVQPGQNIWIPCYCLHHDKRYFPNPEKFDPERFSEENKSKIFPNTYLPFGIGPRICIAERFALMEIKLVLFHLLAKCDLLPSSKTRAPIKLSVNTFAVVPECGFWLRIESRSSKNFVQR